MKTFVCKYLVEANNTGWYLAEPAVDDLGLMLSSQSAMKLAL